MSSTDIILVSDHGMTKTPTENVHHISDVVDTDKIERAVETLAFMFIKVRGVMNLAQELDSEGRIPFKSNKKQKYYKLTLVVEYLGCVDLDLAVGSYDSGPSAGGTTQI